MDEDWLISASVIIDADQQQTTAIWQVRTKGQALDFFLKTFACQTELWIEQIRKQRLSQRMNVGREFVHGQGFDAGDVRRPAHVNSNDLFALRFESTLAVPFDDEKLVSVDRQNLTDSVDGLVERIDELASRAAGDVNFQQTIEPTDSLAVISRLAVLRQRSLHDREELLSVR